ncbi:transposable element Tcb2 transposase [Trichonephila clavipes]|nr:transposable element Tcb2 transposase [Trichonephila clavipes]
MTSRKRVEDSERWRAEGRIEAGQSITDVALYFGVLHSVIPRLWKQLQTTQAVVRRPVGGRPRLQSPRKIDILLSQSDLHTYDINGYSVHW